MSTIVVFNGNVAIQPTVVYDYFKQFSTFNKEYTDLLNWRLEKIYTTFSFSYKHNFIQCAYSMITHSIIDYIIFFCMWYALYIGINELNYNNKYVPN